MLIKTRRTFAMVEEAAGKPIARLICRCAKWRPSLWWKILMPAATSRISGR